MFLFLVLTTSVCVVDLDALRIFFEETGSRLLTLHVPVLAASDSTIMRETLVDL